MLRFTAIILILFLYSANVSAQCVIFLHGLARSEAAMKKLDRHVSRAGFKTINVSYPSTKKPIQKLAAPAIEPALKQCKNEKINFVTHSMGGILVRYYLSKHKIENLHRVVMLGPPNKGSEVVTHLGGIIGFKAINGIAGRQLSTHPKSMPNQLGKVDFPLGIIAGSRSINIILSLIIPGKDDGKVSIDNTKVDGMTDHIVMPVTHTFMMKNKKVAKQVIFFLKNGRFER